jgi:hypothetical protein
LFDDSVAAALLNRFWYCLRICNINSERDERDNKQPDNAIEIHTHPPTLGFGMSPQRPIRPSA